MHNRTRSTRIVTLVTLLAMFAFGATSAFGRQACVQHEAQAAGQTEHHEHGGNDQDSGTTPCQHAALGGLCMSATLPTQTAALSTVPPTPVAVRLWEGSVPHFIAITAVFHPPRF